MHTSQGARAACQGGGQGRLFAGLGGGQLDEAQRESRFPERRPHQRGGSIGGMVVGDEDFEAGGGQGLGGEVAQELGQVGGLVAGGNEDGESAVTSADAEVTP